MAIESLWVEKWRPKTIDGYVFRDIQQKEAIEQWINKREIPHLLFSGSPGIGKTTLAKILINSLGVDDLDVLEINASRTNGVDEVRDRITHFVQMIPFGEFRVVLMDEFDYFSPNGQAALRGILEEYESTARFIFTCNYRHKVIPAIQSRCQGFHMEKLDLTEFSVRIAEVLMAENIDFDIEVLDEYVNSTYPDLRKCINTIQMNSLDGRLTKLDNNDSGLADYRVEMVELFNAGKITEARMLLCANARAEEMEDIYRWLYDNVRLLGKTEKQQEDAIKIIKNGLVDHAIICDPEINLADTLIRLAQNYNR